MVRLHSEKDVYYEYDPSSLPFREDAWGKCYLGKCYSKKNSQFISLVSVCVVPEYNLFIHSMAEKIKNHPCIDYSQSCFIPILDIIERRIEIACIIETYTKKTESYLIEDFYDGVSLNSIMKGCVCGVKGAPIDYAIRMNKLYQTDRGEFAKTVLRVILKGVQNANDNGSHLRFIEYPQCIMFTENAEIKVRMLDSFLHGSDVVFGFTVHPLFLGMFLDKNIAFYSPEGCEDLKSDIYSIGVLLFYILTGRLPYKGECVEKLFRLPDIPFEVYLEDDDVMSDLFKAKIEFRVLQNKGHLLSDEIDDVKLRKIFKKATQRNPYRRYQSANEFAKDLDDDTVMMKIPMHERIISYFKKFLN